jgi:hypothetical protein
MTHPDRRSVLATGGLGITALVLPAASAAATALAPSVADPPGAPVRAATIAGGVVSLTLTTAPTAGSHTYSLWRDRADLAGDPAPDGGSPTRTPAARPCRR